MPTPAAAVVVPPFSTYDPACVMRPASATVSVPSGVLSKMMSVGLSPAAWVPEAVART